MRFPHKRLLLAAALGVPVLLTGCHSRAELITSASADSPNRTVTSDAEPDDSPGTKDDERQLAADSSRAESSEASQSVSVTGREARAAREVLESAGAVIEFDDQGRAQGIDLTVARITPEVARSVADLSDLQWIDLRGTRVTDADLAVICALPQFELIALGQTQITDAGLQHLRQQRKLRFLSLDETAVTDAGLSILDRLPRLEGLSALKTAISKSAAREFEERNPACRVILDDDASKTSSRQPASQQRPADRLQDTVDWSQQASEPQHSTQTLEASIDWSQQTAQTQGGAESTHADTRHETIDWSQPSRGTRPTPEQPEWPTQQRETAQPAPGEPTAATNQDAAWLLDEAQPTVPVQPLPSLSAAPRSSEPSLELEEPLPRSFEPQAPSQQPAAQQNSVQITPVRTATSTISSGSPEETAQQLNQILQQRLLDPEVLTVLSRHLLAQQQYAKAARALEALAALQPDDPQIRFDLGVALARSGDYNQAHPQLASVVGEATAWYNLGVIAFERDQPQHSERYFGRAIDLEPDFTEARTWLARVRETPPAVNSPAQAQQSVDGQDLVELLMSEFGTAGAVGASPAPIRSESGITIVPGH